MVLYINCTLCLFCVIFIKYDLVVFTIVIQTVECPLSLCIVTFHNLVQLFMVVTCVFCIRRVPRLLFFLLFYSKYIYLKIKYATKTHSIIQVTCIYGLLEGKSVKVLRFYENPTVKAFWYIPLC